jgi:hypothetical protein
MAQQLDLAGTPVVDAPTGDPVEAQLSRELELLVQENLNQVLEYHLTHRPSNTIKNYLPKQKEWKAWCKTKIWPLGGSFLPGDWVDEGKLLLFITEEVASRPPQKGARLNAEKKRKAEERA